MGCPLDCPLDNACPTNQDCDGHRPVCPANLTTWVETIIQSVTTVKASHISELETAINNERTHPIRRDVIPYPPACLTNCSDAYTFSGSRSIGDLVRASHWLAIENANNTTPFGSSAATGIYIGKLIEKFDIDALRAAIIQTEYNCICDTQCTCNYNCGCNGECPYYGSYYYY